jgi:hypothetical protein
MPTSTEHRGAAGSMLLDRGIPAELTSLTDSVTIHARYSAYKKVMSVARLAVLGLPILEGFVTHSINDEVLEYLEYWMRESQMERLTVRFDFARPDERKGRMTSDLTLEELKQKRHLMHDGVAAIIMEESDRLRQSYGVLTAFAEDCLICEVVGPGFDVDELMRGQILPHERFVFRRKDIYDDNYRDLGPTDVIHHSIIAREAYLQSVEYRYSKFSDIICREAGDLEQGSCLPDQQSQEVEAIVEQRSTTLLYHKDRYVPLSYAKLHELYGYISELDVFNSSEVRGKVAVASFLKKQGLVFWDLFGGIR